MSCPSVVCRSGRKGLKKVLTHSEQIWSDLSHGIIKALYPGNVLIARTLTPLMGTVIEIVCVFLLLKMFLLKQKPTDMVETSIRACCGHFSHFFSFFLFSFLNICSCLKAPLIRPACIHNSFLSFLQRSVTSACFLHDLVNPPPPHCWMLPHSCVQKCVCSKWKYC